MRTTCPKLCHPMWTRPVRLLNQHPWPTRHNMTPLHPTALPDVGKQAIRVTLVHTTINHNLTIQTLFTSPNQHCRHQPMHHNTPGTARQHARGLVHHRNVRHHWPTLKHLPPENQHTTPPTTRLPHPICLPLVPKNQPLPTLCTWHRLPVGLPMCRRHNIERLYYRNNCPSRLKYPTVLFTGTFPTSPNNRMNIYTAFFKCLLFLSRQSPNHMRLSTNGASIVTSTSRQWSIPSLRCTNSAGQIRWLVWRNGLTQQGPTNLDSSSHQTHVIKKIINLAHVRSMTLLAQKTLPTVLERFKISSSLGPALFHPGTLSPTPWKNSNIRMNWTN